MSFTVFGFSRRAPVFKGGNQTPGREVSSLQLLYFSQRSSYQQAVEKANELMTQSEAVGFAIRCLPMTESEKVKIKSNPELPRPWGIFILTRVLLKACVNKSCGNSRQVEVVMTSTPDSLAKLVNERTREREVADVEIIYDDSGPERERWKANLYFLYDTMGQRLLDR